MNEWAACQRKFRRRNCKQQRSESTGRNLCSCGMKIWTKGDKNETPAAVLSFRSVCCKWQKQGKDRLQRKHCDRIQYLECNLTSFVVFCISHHIPITYGIVQTRVSACLILISGKGRKQVWTLQISSQTARNELIIHRSLHVWVSNFFFCAFHQDDGFP